MAPRHYIKEREVWLVDLNPTRGIEIRKKRPCIVLRKFSPEHFVVLPITNKEKPEHISYVLSNISFLHTDEKTKSWVNISQIRTVGSGRFERRMGKVSHHTFSTVQNKTAEVLRLPPQEPSGHNRRAD